MRILCADDREIDRLLIRQNLRRSDLNAEFFEASTCAETLSLIQDQPFDCALLDYTFPDGTGLDLLREIEAREIPLPIIMLTGRGDERLAVELMKSGAMDYLPKTDLTPLLLSRTIQAAVSRHQREQSRKAQFAAEKYARLLQVSNALSGAVTTTEVAEVVLQAALAIFQAEGFLAQIRVEDDESSITLIGGAGQRPSPSQAGEPPELSSVLLGAIRSRRLIVRFPEKQAAVSLASDSPALLAVPLLAGERVVGALGLRCPPDRCENTAQQTLLWTLAGQCALALERARLFDAAQARADRDPLTNLLNHRSFHKRLEEEALRVTREETSLAVVMLDLDNFRFFNDVYGHATGDEVLRQVAERLQSLCKPEDVISRFGGDEFSLLLCDTGDRSPRQIETHILSAMDGLSYQSAVQDDAIPIRLSAGAAILRHTDLEWQGVIKGADARLRRRKMGEEIDGEAQIVRSVALNDVEGFSMLDALVTAVDNKDHYTLRHSNDVMSYSLAIARELGLGREELHTISLGALLHDVGKIGVPDAILRKPGRLTREEFEAVKQHPQMGAMIVATVPELESTLDAIRYHHERWDGHGYPAGLHGEQIPLIARIMAVADAYSAMTSDRPYRKGMDRALALSLLEEGAGTQWDPRCVAAFVQAVTPSAIETP